MTRSERAAQIWPLLTLCASHRQTLSYDLLGRLIGVPRQGLGQLLEPIQSFCILNGLEPLTSLVVSDITGLPSEGFIGAQDVPAAQAKVFAENWLAAPPPSTDALENADGRLPCHGRSIEGL